MNKTKKRKMSHITRYTLAESDFNGFRLTKTFKGDNFQKYYSVKVFGTVKKAEAAVKLARTRLLEVLDNATLSDGKLSKSSVAKCNQAMNIILSEVI